MHETLRCAGCEAAFATPMELRRHYQRSSCTATPAERDGPESDSDSSSSCEVAQVVGVTSRVRQHIGPSTAGAAAEHQPRIGQPMQQPPSTPFDFVEMLGNI